MIDQMVSVILQQVKNQYPGIELPAAMRAIITSVSQTGKKYRTDCKITVDEKVYHCRIERDYYQYTVKVLDNRGNELEQFPELIEIESREQYGVGDVVQVVFLGNELEAAIVGG